MRTPQERRRHQRINVQHPVKLQCRATGRYFAAATYNLSAVGALLEVDHPSRLVVGQQVRVAVAADAAQVLLRASRMRDAVVVRSEGSGRRHRIAVQFARAQRSALSAAA